MTQNVMCGSNERRKKKNSVHGNDVQRVANDRKG